MSIHCESSDVLVCDNCFRLVLGSRSDSKLFTDVGCRSKVAFMSCRSCAVVEA
uniref:Uncharacterized protein n=1 Tax=Arundo donax TaxID=35708 RepID=A0A0A9BZJ7_ARUDO